MSGIKQVIIIRNNLNMRKGKMCAQASHASMKVFFDRLKETFQGYFTYRENNSTIIKACKSSSYFILTDSTPEMLEWMRGSFAKIVVRCNSLEELLELETKAKDANIPCALITDNGNTEFKVDCLKCHGEGVIQGFRDYPIECDNCKGKGKIGNPTITCLAIGPDKSERIDSITGHLELL